MTKPQEESNYSLLDRGQPMVAISMNLIAAGGIGFGFTGAKWPLAVIVVLMMGIINALLSRQNIGREPTLAMTVTIASCNQLGVAVLVYCSGGIHSPFVLLFYLGVVVAGMSSADHARLSVIIGTLATVGLLALYDLVFLGGLSVSAFGTLAMTTVFLLAAGLMTNHAVDAIQDTNSRRIDAELARQKLDIQNLQLARTSELKDQFLANMSHELRTPLHSILGTVEVLETTAYGDINQRQEKALRHIQENGRHLLALINDVLDLSRIEKGTLTLDMTQVDLKQVCEMVVHLIRPQIHKKQQTLSLSLNSTPPIMADSRRIKQIALNLMSNASKFTPAGGRIGLETTSSGDTVQICVWDEGKGISEDQIPLLFRPFVQVHGDLDRNHEGSGLGLSLVDRMVTLHKGSIDVWSIVDEGSRFTVTLPAHSGSTEAVKPSHEEEKNPTNQQEIAPIQTAPEISESKPQNQDIGASTENMKVLIVDDNIDSMPYLQDFLELTGYQVFSADNAVTGLEIIRESRPHVVLMDIQMPGMDGLQAIDFIRKDASICSTKVIAVTALAMAGDEERCLNAGADAYLSKPFRMKQLKARIVELASQA